MWALHTQTLTERLKRHASVSLVLQHTTHGIDDCVAEMSAQQALHHLHPRQRSCDSSAGTGPTHLQGALNEPLNVEGVAESDNTGVDGGGGERGVADNGIEEGEAELGREGRQLVTWAGPPMALPL